MEIGIQVSSLKPLLLTEDQVREAFAKMRGLGCRTVQLQWIDPSVSAEAIAEALRDNEIRSVSVQDFYTCVEENFDYYANLNTATGGKWLCVSRIPEHMKSRSGLNQFILHLRSMQEHLSALGQALCFHPIVADYGAVSGINAVEYLLDNMPELALCLDLYHLNKVCDDMPGFIRRYGSRICMVHFKDASGDTLVPAGQGDTNWTGVVQACLKARIAYAFAEQERWDRDPFDCLGEAMEWLENEICAATK